MNDQDKYPYCRAVQNVLIKYRDFDPADYDGELGLVLKAYDCSCGCIDESVWPIEELERSIADKFRLAIIGCLGLRGYDEATYRVIVEPDHVGCTQYAAFIAGTDQVNLRDGCKAWHFGHDDGTLDDLEAFFAELVETVSRCGVRKYDDLYGLLDDVEAEIGWACTVDGLAALMGKSAEYRNGEGPDPLDDGDTHWEFAIIDQEPVESRFVHTQLEHERQRLPEPLTDFHMEARTAEDEPKVTDYWLTIGDLSYRYADVGELHADLSKLVSGLSPTVNAEDTRFIECDCGQWEEFHAQEQRWHSQAFEWVQNLDGHLTNEAIYKCPDCGELVVSHCELINKED